MRSLILIVILISLFLIAVRFFSGPEEYLLGDGAFSVALRSRRSASFATGKVAGKEIEILLDTGSDHFWVKHHFLGEAWVNRKFEIEYAGGRVVGVHGTGAFEIGMMKWNQTAGVVLEASPQLADVQSVLGLSRSCRDGSLCAMKHWKLKRMVFSFDSQKFIAGEIDDSRCGGNSTIHWIPQNTMEPFFWITKMDLLIGDELIATEINGLWDTGTTLLYVSLPIFLKLKNYGCKQMPTITFKFGDRRFDLPGNAYTKSTFGGKCDLLVSVIEPGLSKRIRTDVLIGWTFIRTHYVVFDLETDRVGLCPQISLLTLF